MTAEGWHLNSLGFPGVYKFLEGDPAEYVYRLDYQTLYKKDRESYLQLFQDAGWEHVADMSGWAYFRKKIEPGADLEIFNNPESKIKKYQRIMLYLVSLFPVLVIPMLTLGNRIGPFFQAVQGLYFIWILIYIYAMIRLLIRQGELKKEE